MKHKKLFNLFSKSTCGATAIEYAVIAALISVVIVAAITAVGKQMNTTFSKVGSNMTKANL